MRGSLAVTSIRDVQAVIQREIHEATHQRAFRDSEGVPEEVVHHQPETLQRRLVPIRESYDSGARFPLVASAFLSLYYSRSKDGHRAMARQAFLHLLLLRRHPADVSAASLPDASADLPVGRRAARDRAAFPAGIGRERRRRRLRVARMAVGRKEKRPLSAFRDKAPGFLAGRKPR